MFGLDLPQTSPRKRDPAGAGGAVRAGHRHVYRSHQMRCQGLQVPMRAVTTCPRVRLALKTTGWWQRRWSTEVFTGRKVTGRFFHVTRLPMPGRFFGNRSYCYHCLEKYPQALTDAERSIQLAPDWPKGHFRQGSALMGMKVC